MNLRLDLHLLGGLLALVGVFQCLPVGAAILFQENPWPYVASAFITLLSGILLFSATYTQNPQIRPRDGFFVVSCAWVLTSVFCALPYVTTGTFHPVNAFFESVAGLTTTGSTVFARIEGVPRSLLLWRSFSQWLGGMGIILFTIAILPLMGIGGMQLFKAEVPGPIADKLRPRVTETARRLWYIYVGFTATECVALRLAGMNWYEAICHAFTTMSTGGFSTRTASIGAFHSAAVEWILIVFMLMAGVNFVLHYQMWVGRRWIAWRDGEFRYYSWVVLGASAVVAGTLWLSDVPPGSAVRSGAFQVVSILTTTGYVTKDMDRWPFLVQFILLSLMFLGGMSGSTSGGVKSLRALIGLRALRATFDRLLHPQAVCPVKHGGRPVSAKVLEDIWAFFAAYFLIIVVAAAVVTAYGYDLITAISAAMTSISNVGPGLGDIGATENFAHFPTLVKLVLAGCMIAGRLEVFTLFVLFLPAFWRR